MDDTKARVYIIDDDDAVRDSLSLQLEATGYEVATFPSAVGFLEIAGDFGQQLVGSNPDGGGEPALGSDALLQFPRNGQAKCQAAISVRPLALRTEIQIGLVDRHGFDFGACRGDETEDLA